MSGTSFDFYLWHNVNGKWTIKEIISATPAGSGVQTLSLSPPVEIEVGDLLGTWIDSTYPFATAKLSDQVCMVYTRLQACRSASKIPLQYHCCLNSLVSYFNGYSWS